MEISMKRLIFATCLFLFFSFTAAQSVDIKAMCEQRWPGEADMQASCEKTQRAGFYELIRLADNRGNLSEEAFQEVFETCMSHWHPDYAMQAHCLKEETGAVIIAETVTQTAPNRSDFMILSFFGRWEYGHFYVIGEVKNTGAVSAGVELEAIARDANGVLIDSTSFWPNSISNLAPGESVGVEAPVTSDERAETLELRVKGTRMWN